MFHYMDLPACQWSNVGVAEIAMYPGSEVSEIFEGFYDWLSGRRGVEHEDKIRAEDEEGGERLLFLMTT